MSNNQILDSKNSNRKREKDLWTQQQIQKLFQLYEQYGPNWTKIISSFKNKQSHTAKNKVNMALSKTVANLQAHQNQNSKRKCSKITLDILLNILDCGFKVKEKFQEIDQTKKMNSFLLQLRKQIIKMSFKYTEFENSEIYMIIQKIKYLNVRIRSYGLFKLKNRKNWKIGDNLLRKIIQLDQELKKKGLDIIRTENDYIESQMSELVVKSSEIQSVRNEQQLFMRQINSENIYQCQSFFLELSDLNQRNVAQIALLHK